MKISVAGIGYVGIVTAVCLASKGHDVTCIDVDKEKILKLKDGISPIYEEGLEELMKENKERLTYTVDCKIAYKDADVIFVGVGTPEKEDGSANLTYIYSVCDQIAQTVNKNCVVVIKSTVPVGTNQKIEDYINSKVKKGIHIDIASNPEFLSQGTAVKDTLFASRIVIGAQNETVKNIMLEVYKDFDAPVIVTNRESAEMIKYASNDFLALKISYINEIANLCEMVGANIEDVAKEATCTEEGILRNYRIYNDIYYKQIYKVISLLRAICGACRYDNTCHIYSNRPYNFGNIRLYSRFYICGREGQYRADS